MLGGSGEAFSVTTPPAPLRDPFNNDGWCDDTSDGRLTAEITIDGTPYQSTAWLIVAPPKFAPQLTPLVSLWDRLVDAHCKPSDDPPSYTQHIQPILDRGRKMRWVHQRADAHSSDWDSDPIYDEVRSLGQLVREYVFQSLKGSGTPGFEMPRQLTIGSLPDPDPDGDRLTDTQLAWMREWSRGNFIRDWNSVSESNTPLTPDGLDQAALEACIGAALYPGIEAGHTS